MAHSWASVSLMAPVEPSAIWAGMRRSESSSGEMKGGRWVTLLGRVGSCGCGEALAEGIRVGRRRRGRRRGKKEEGECEVMIRWGMVKMGETRMGLFVRRVWRRVCQECLREGLRNVKRMFHAVYRRKAHPLPLEVWSLTREACKGAANGRIVACRTKGGGKRLLGLKGSGLHRPCCDILVASRRTEQEFLHQDGAYWSSKVCRGIGGKGALEKTRSGPPV